VVFLKKDLMIMNDWMSRGQELLKGAGRNAQMAKLSQGAVRFYSSAQVDAEENFRLLLPLLVSDEGCQIRIAKPKCSLWCVEISPTTLPPYFDASISCRSNTVKQAVGVDGWEFIDPFRCDLTTVVFLGDQIKAIESARRLLRFMPEFCRFSLVECESEMYRNRGSYALLGKSIVE